MNEARYAQLRCMAAEWIRRADADPVRGSADALAAGAALNEALDEVWRLRRQLREAIDALAAGPTITVLERSAR